MSATRPARRLTDLPELADLPSLLRDDDPNDVLRAFAGTHAFRAAAREELTTEDNPYRRPVRPDDLEWLDYSAPMPTVDARRLSALLGHRMLRAVHDLDQHHLPATAGPAATEDAASSLTPRTRALAALATPVLVGHLFAPLDALEPVHEGDPVALATRVRAEYDERADAPGEAWIAAEGTRHRRDATTFVLLQQLAYRPVVATALGLLAQGEYGQAHPSLAGELLELATQWVRGAPGYRELLTAAGLAPGAGAYWQFSLGSSLGRGNHLQHLARTPERFAAALGAVAHELLDQTVTAPALDALVRTTFAPPTSAAMPTPGEPSGPPGGLALDGDTLADLTRRWVAPLTERFGRSVLEDFGRGFAEARWYARLWDADLAEQLRWADDIEEYQEKASKIDRYLSDEGIEVDLDTFVESHEETSTTHVHDDHRLVMVERGRMHFWNNVTHRIELGEGDKLLIPASRLHGSTVLSGECTYHQPIIPDEMLARFL